MGEEKAPADSAKVGAGAGVEPIYFDLTDTDDAALDHLADLCISLTGTYDNEKVRRLALSVPALITEIRRLRSLTEGEQTTEMEHTRTEYRSRNHFGVYVLGYSLDDARAIADGRPVEQRERLSFVGPWSPVPEEQRDV